MADQPNIDIATLRQLLAYDAETGELTWLHRSVDMFDSLRSCAVWNARYASTRALASDNRGYLEGRIFNRHFKAHRVAWALHYGQWPAGDIDHINGNPRDNCIANLRVVDHVTNMRNVKRRSDSASGTTGVSWFKRKQKWQVRIGATHVGYFSDFNEAVSARREAEAASGFHPNHGRST